MANAAAEGLYFDDIIIGSRFLSGTHELTEEQIIAFAKQFDPQPFHIDKEAAKHSLFGGLVASGWHTGAITMRLIIGDGSPIAGGIISRGGEVSWLQPARAGDVLQVTSEVVEKTPSKSNPMRGNVVIKSETRNQQGEVIQILIAKLVVQRRADSK